MRKMNIPALPEAIQTHLEQLQAQVDALPGFPVQVQKAKTLWDKKATSKPSKEIFKELAKSLNQGNPGVELCGYCECNEASDIEHIFPKSFFPDKAFIPENYLLACKQCNTGHKLDKFAVFDTQGQRYDCQRGVQPPTDRALLINPRQEDPADFMVLNLLGGMFVCHPQHQETDVPSIRVAYTLELLELNSRPTLVAGRKRAYKAFCECLRGYVAAKQAVDYEALGEVIRFPDELDRGLPFETSRQRAMEIYQQQIQMAAHPAVWQTIKWMVQRHPDVMGDLPVLFQSAPEAYSW